MVHGVRAALAAVSGAVWRMVGHGPLGSVLSILLALGIGSVALFSLRAQERAAGNPESRPARVQDSLRAGESTGAVAVPLPGTVVPALPPPFVSGNDQYTRWLYAPRVVYLVDSQAEAEILRPKMEEDDARRVMLGARPRDDLILVAGSAEEWERAVEILNHHDGIRASLNLPGFEVIDLRTR